MFLTNDNDKMIIIIIIMIYCRLQRPIAKELSLSGAIYKNVPQIFTTSVIAAWWPTDISCSLSQAPPRLHYICF